MEHLETLQPQQLILSSGFQRESRRPRHVLIWVVPTASYNNQEHNIFTFNTFSMGQIRDISQELSWRLTTSIYYPQLEMTSDEESRLYRALMSFNSGYNDFLSGPLIDRANFKKISLG